MTVTFDQHVNFAYSTVQAVSGVIGSTSGTTINIVNTLDLPDLAAGAYNVTVWPSGVSPTRANAEIMRVTAKTATTLTVTRAQEGTAVLSAIAAGYQVALAMTQKLLTDIETAIPTGGGGGGGTGLLYDSGEITASQPNFSITSIPATFHNLTLLLSLRGHNASGSLNVGVRFNSERGANYDSSRIRYNNGAVGSFVSLGTSIQSVAATGASATVGNFGNYSLTVNNYLGTGHKALSGTGGLHVDDTIAGGVVDAVEGMWKSTAAITQITLIPLSGSNLVAGSRVMLYGS